MTIVSGLRIIDSNAQTGITWWNWTTSNMIERLNQSVKQRTKVAKIFANEDSCLRLVSAVVMEISDEWQSSKAYLSLSDDKFLD